MPAEPAPGQAAYEAFLPGGPIDWEYADSDVRAMWAAAHDAVAAPLDAEITRLRVAAAELRSRLDDLASHWNREYASETGWPSRCAAELREALEGGGDE